MSKNTSHLFLDGLDLARQEVFKTLKSFSTDFVLAGGTALMLQIGHRTSYDFDLFTSKAFPKKTFAKFKRVFGSSISEFKTDEIMLLKTKNNIDVHFVVDQSKILRPLVKTSTVSLLSVDDLAANKTHVVSRRGTWRDYVDLFFLLKWKLYSISDLIKLAKEKFPDDFGEKLFLEELGYFADILIMPTTFLKEKYTTQEIQSYLQDSVSAYCQNNPKFQ